MAYLLWDDQIPAKQNYFASLEEVKATVRSLPFLTQESDGTLQDDVITNAMDAAKYDLKERVMLRAQNAFPQQIAKYRNSWIRQQQNFFDAFYPAGTPNIYGYISIFGVFVDLNAQNYTDRAAVFVNFGAPTAGLYDDTALNGSFLWDTQHNIMYIQRGSDTVVNWQLFDPSDLVNFIANPDILHKAFIYGTIYFLFEERTTNDTTNNVNSVALYAGQEERYEKKYDEFAGRAMSMLDLDISNYGIITSQDIAFQTANDWACV